MNLILQASREIIFLISNYVLHLKKTEYCFCQKYKGATYCKLGGKQYCLICQIIDPYAENELYLIRYNEGKLIRFAFDF